MTARDLVAIVLLGGAGLYAYRQLGGALQGGQGAQVAQLSYIDAAKEAALSSGATGSLQQQQANPIGAILGLAFNLLGSASATSSASSAGPTTTTTPPGLSTPANFGDWIMNSFAGGQSTSQSSAGLSGLLNLIGRSEGAGYNTVYGGSKVKPPVPLSQMTVAQVMDWQSQSVAAGSASSAAGKYQIIRPTLATLVSSGVVNPSDPFDAATQDRAATALLQGRGLSQYQSGEISAQDFANNLAKEWASLPVVTGPNAGASYYAGDGLNSARMSVSSVMGAISSV